MFVFLVLKCGIFWRDSVFVDFDGLFLKMIVCRFVVFKDFEWDVLFVKSLG